MINKESVKGPYILENWRAFLDGKAKKEMREFPIYSDVKVIIGEETNKYKPYSFINPVPIDRSRGDFCPVLYVRIEEYLESTIPDFTSTQTEAYHGGYIIDEIAALLSLALGIRAKAGPMTRHFPDPQEPQGRPEGWERQPRFLDIDHDNLVIPNAVEGRKTISEISLFAKIHNLGQDEANALIKSARAYQNALLVAEEDPSLSWIFLVTAIERAALEWISSEKSDIDIYKEIEPAFSKELESLSEKAFGIVAKKYAKLSKSTWRFREFLRSHLPDPPAIRPPDYAKLNWDNTKLEEAFNSIYGHRSNALHEGTPFPFRICECPPRTKKENGEVCWHEKPIGTGASALGGTWLEKDLPMYLNTFEYIVRNSLKRWWQGLGNTKK